MRMRNAYASCISDEEVTVSYRDADFCHVIFIQTCAYD